MLIANRFIQAVDVSRSKIFIRNKHEVSPIEEKI